jgi:hypothetical protein
MLTNLATSQNSFKKEDIGGDGHPSNKDLTPPNPILFLTLIIQRVPNNKSLITNKP